VQGAFQELGRQMTPWFKEEKKSRWVEELNGSYFGLFLNLDSVGQNISQLKKNGTCSKQNSVLFTHIITT
jgi:hypothetical protein